MEDCGTTRISNPKTLQRWVDFGWYKDRINQGYIFNPYCGRFSMGECTCTKCRHKIENKEELIKIIKNYERLF
jgi:transposase